MGKTNILSLQFFKKIYYVTYKSGKNKISSIVKLYDGKVIFENKELEILQTDLHKSEGTVILSQAVSKNCKWFMKKEVGM